MIRKEETQLTDILELVLKTQKPTQMEKKPRIPSLMSMVPTMVRVECLLFFCNPPKNCVVFLNQRLLFVGREPH